MILKTDPASSQSLKLERNLAGRDFAVGDVHGTFSALQTAFDSIGFDPTVDRLLCCGDLVDRGPESHRVEAWLEKSWVFRALVTMITCRRSERSTDLAPSRLPLPWPLTAKSRRPTLWRIWKLTCWHLRERVGPLPCVRYSNLVCGGC